MCTHKTCIRLRNVVSLQTEKTERQKRRRTNVFYKQEGRKPPRPAATLF